MERRWEAINQEAVDRTYLVSSEKTSYHNCIGKAGLWERAAGDKLIQIGRDLTEESGCILNVE